jgi:hypothetical protein
MGFCLGSFLKCVYYVFNKFFPGPHSACDNFATWQLYAFTKTAEVSLLF